MSAALQHVADTTIDLSEGLEIAGIAQAGVERVHAILSQEIDQTLALLGRSNLTEIDESVVEVPASWNGP